MISDPMIMLAVFVPGILLVALVWRFPGAGVAVAMLSFALTAIQVPVSVDPRPALVAVTAIHLLRNMTTGKPLLHISAVTPFIFSSLALCGWMTLSLLWSEKFGETLGAALGYASVLLFVSTYSEYLLRRESRKLVAWILAAIILTSLLAMLGQAQWAFLGDRARGITNNPNALGIFSIFWMAIAASFRWRYLLPIWITGLVSISMAASRASLAGAVVVIAIVIFFRVRSIVHRMLLAACLALATYWFVTAGFATVSSSTDALVLRTNNSRSEEIAEAMAYFEQNFWNGGGAGVYAIEPGSFLKLAAELGIVGLLISVVLVVSYLVRTRIDLAAFSAVGGALANGAIEGWLFTGGSVYLLFLLVIVTGAKLPAKYNQSKPQMTAGSLI